MHTHGRGQAVDDEVERPEIPADALDRLLPDGVRERVAVDRAGAQPLGPSEAQDRRSVVIARGRGLLVGGRPLEKDAERPHALGKRGRDPGGQAIARGGADDQGVAASGRWRRLRPCPAHLQGDGLGTAGRMSVDADETSQARRDDFERHGSSDFSNRLPRREPRPEQSSGLRPGRAASGRPTRRRCRRRVPLPRRLPRRSPGS